MEPSISCFNRQSQSHRVCHWVWVCRPKSLSSEPNSSWHSWSFRPTFALANCHDAGDVMVHHLDVYRVADLDELEAAGARDLLFDPGAVCFVEWFDRVAKELGADHLHVEIARRGDRRRALIRAHGPRPERVLEELRARLADLIPRDRDDAPPVPGAARQGAPRGAAGAPPKPRDGDGT